MSAVSVTLEEKYTRETGRIFVSGIEALVRLPMLQHQRDQLAGLDTAGFISGYRGSPLGALDQNLWKAASHLQKHNIQFSPGVNEDLAATSIWGSQQVNLFSGGKYDGVFGMWYGKGPGVDRSGDVFKHANAAGSAPHGGVLAIAGDDHLCKSSTLPHQSEYAFIDALMPILNPAGVQDILDFGIYGWALSRYSGCWVGFKAITESMDASASVDIDTSRIQIQIPDDFEFPEGGLSIRWPDAPREQELRLHKYKLYAALAFARANKLNRIVIDSPKPRLGIITTGKSYLDVRQALDDLGIDDEFAGEIGLRLYKIGMTWPLEREGVRQFAEGLDEVLVVEEKRAVIENQLKEQLYNWRADVRPRVVGKFGLDGEWILPSAGELTPARIARVIASRIKGYVTSSRIEDRLAFLEAKEKALERNQVTFQRVPHYCSGCPHNTSTKVPDGSRALAGIGCHFMATWMDRSTETFTQMGGEGATWIGQAPFTETPHVFQNLGDGTYFHSGLLAIRAALASGVNITYKILYNDAVAMTGGQPIDGQLSVAQITLQLAGEGVTKMLVVSDTPEVYERDELAPNVEVYHRRQLDSLQRQLREIKGVSVLIYAQTCAAEKRRRRKRGLMEDPAKRVFIHPAVCEGCGDCGTVSNCLAVQPLETEFGRKRVIDQSACNKDYSCAEALCPSFITVEGGDLNQIRESEEIQIPDLPEPGVADSSKPYNMVIAGVGGTGVVTVGAILGMAAHIDGRGSAVLDMTGLAQKFGAVVSHVRVAKDPDAIHAPRIPAGEAHLLLGCDIVVSASFESLAKVKQNQTIAVVNDHDGMPAAFTREPDLLFPGADLREAISEATGHSNSFFVNATRLATRLTGDAIMSNLFMIGFALQKGALPISLNALQEAVRLNGVAVDKNLLALDLGRWAAIDQSSVESLVKKSDSGTPETMGLEELIEHRKVELVKYQGQSYAAKLERAIERIAAMDEAVSGDQSLVHAVVFNYFKVLAYKDEYEVARLLSDEAQLKNLKGNFTGSTRIFFNLAPTWLNWIQKNRTRPIPRKYGSWIAPLLRLVSKFRFLRGTAFDPFGWQDDRRIERQMIKDYEADLRLISDFLTADNYALAVKLASLPEMVRGFGFIKVDSAKAFAQKRTDLRSEFSTPPSRQSKAA